MSNEQMPSELPSYSSALDESNNEFSLASTSSCYSTISAPVSDSIFSAAHSSATNHSFEENMVLHTGSATDVGLPAYFSGARVSRTPCQAGTGELNTLKINIVNEKSSYDLEEYISGELIFTPYEEIEVSSIFVVFEGEEATGQSPLHTAIKRQLKLAHHIVPPSMLPLDQKAKPGLIYSFQFTFQVPQTPIENTCKDFPHKHNFIPPSFGSPTSDSPGTEGSISKSAARIFYRLRACVKRRTSSEKISTHCSGLKYIQIHPTAKSFNFCVPQAIIPTVRQELRKNIFAKSSRGLLRLTFQNVPNVLFKSSPSITASAILSFIPSHPSQVPLKILNISTQLVVSTIYALKAPLLQTDVSSRSQSTTQVTSGRFSPSRTDWALDLGVASLESSSVAYSSVHHLPIIFPNEMASSFESCYIACSYILKVKFHFEEKHTILIELPLWII